MSWRPVVSGKLRDEVAARVVAIADQLIGEPQWFKEATPWLVDGSAGMALAFAYLDAVMPGRGYGDTSEKLLEQAIAGMAATEGLGPEHCGLFSGYTGVAVVTELLTGAAVGDAVEEVEEDDANGDIDLALEQILSVKPFPGHFDLISGLVGVGFYLLQRASRTSSQHCLSLLLDQLALWSEERPSGIFWRTPPRFVPERRRQSAPDGEIDLGLAHGQYGVLAFLAGACEVPAVAVAARQLLLRQLGFLLDEARRPPNHQRSFFSEDAKPSGVRVAWCYGDPGIATALLLAARATEDEQLERRAVAIATEAASLSLEASHVPDAGFCHGTAGLMHIYNRIAQSKNDPLLYEATQVWLGHTLELAKSGSGIGGYTVFDPATHQWLPNARLLEGSTGIALALASAITDVEPVWDTVFGLSGLSPK